MEKFVLTKETMDKAITYMPLADKQQLAREVAEHCIDFVATRLQRENTPMLLATPQIKGENVALKLMLLQNVLLGHYLDIEIDVEKDAWETYDYYGGQHLINQIERFKADAELKCKAFDLLADYKEFERMVNVEIYNIKVYENDAINRLNKALALVLTPENVEKIREQLKTAIAENNKEQVVEA